MFGGYGVGWHGNSVEKIICMKQLNDFFKTFLQFSGESLAELYHGSTGVVVKNIVVRLWLLLIVVMLLS